MTAPKLNDTRAACVILAGSPGVIREHLTHRSVGELSEVSDICVRQVQKLSRFATPGTDPLEYYLGEVRGVNPTPAQLDACRRDAIQRLVSNLEARQAADKDRVARLNQYLTETKAVV